MRPDEVRGRGDADEDELDPKRVQREAPTDRFSQEDDDLAGLSWEIQSDVRVELDIAPRASAERGDDREGDSERVGKRGSYRT